MKIYNFIINLDIFFSFIISFYHFGIEQGFFEESAVCGLKNTSKLFLKKNIKTITRKNCKL